MVVTSQQALQARESFKESYPKLPVPGLSSNGEKGWKLVITVSTESDRKKVPPEIDGVPVDVRVWNKKEKSQ